MTSTKGDYIRHQVRDTENNKKYWSRFNRGMDRFADYGYEWKDWQVQHEYSLAHELGFTYN